jgi:dihydrofolate reductase
MRKLIVTEFITLDGMFEDPAPPPGYSSPDIGQFKRDELFESGALMLGRVTYESFAKYWPTQKGTSDFAERMNSLPKFVATTTLKNLEWNATRLEGDVVSAVKKLKQQEGQNILVYGSGTFAQTLLKHKLADELRLLVYPLVRGVGQRFFTGKDKLSLKLASSREIGGAGVMLLVYEPAVES